MNEVQIMNIMEQYVRGSEPVEGQIMVMRVPDYKTVYIEEIDGVGRSIVLSEYKVDGKPYWAGYSARSNSVIFSQAYRE